MKHPLDIQQSMVELDGTQYQVRKYVGSNVIIEKDGKQLVSGKDFSIVGEVVSTVQSFDDRSELSG